MKSKRFEKDLYRWYGGNKETLIQRLFRPQEIRYMYHFRKSQDTNGFFFKSLHRFLLYRISSKTQIQIPWSTRIGDGFYIGHCGRIIINSKAVLGKNINIATGVTIGQENRGERQGCPKIGDNVWIGTNSVIVGNINIGDDVLIAPLTFVNFSVPSHSIVIGNPAKIIYKEKATEHYIDYTV